MILLHTGLGIITTRSKQGLPWGYLGQSGEQLTGNDPEIFASMQVTEAIHHATGRLDFKFVWPAALEGSICKRVEGLFVTPLRRVAIAFGCRQRQRVQAIRPGGKIEQGRSLSEIWITLNPDDIPPIVFCSRGFPLVAFWPCLLDFSYPTKSLSR